MKPANAPQRFVTRLNSFILIGVFVILAAVVAVPVYSAHSGSVPAERSSESLVAAGGPASISQVNPLFASAIKPLSGWSSTSPQPLPVPQPAETIATYASDCTTSKTNFVVGETVCVQVTGIPLSAFFPRHLTWATTDSTIVRSTDITTDPQSDSLLITATTVIGSTTIDNRGIWTVVVRNPFFFFPEAIANFTVTDPAHAAADLGVASTFASDSVQVGSQASFGLQVNNYGPDSAVNVSLTDAVPSGASFVSFTQLSGPTFTCGTSSGLTTCTLASMNSGDVATFLATYTANSGTEITNTAIIASSTSDLFGLNNTISISTPVTPNNGSGCTLTCPANIVASNDPGTGGHVIPSGSFPQPTTSGTCGTVTLSVTPDPQTNNYTFPIGTSFVTAEADTGDTCTFTVTVNDVEAPTITCPADITTFESPAGSGFRAVNFTVTANDNSGTVDNPAGSATVTCDHPSGSSFPVGSTPVICTATDDAGHTSPSCTFHVVVNAVSSTCVFTSPGPIVANSDANACGTHVPYTPPSSDGSGTCGTITCDHPPGSFFPGGQTLVTCTSSPDGGSTSFTVTVNDTTAPVPDLATLPTITKDCTADAGIPVVIGAHTVFIPPTATDNCGGKIQGETDDPVVYPNPGTFTVHWKYTDPSGNSSSQDQTINVTGSDTTPPVPDVANPMVTGECQVTATPLTATDDCDGTITGTTSDPLTYVGVGTHIIHWTYVDQAGHPVQQDETVIVTDTHNPTIALVGASSITVECHTSFSDPGVTTTDNCLPKNVTVTTTGTVNVNIPNVYTLTYTATDGGGNQASVQRTVIVSDTIKPVITLNGANPQYVECHTSYPELGATANDSCAGSFAATPSGSVNANVVGTYTITYNATDPSGNAATPVTRTVIVQDTIPPVITLNGVTPSMWPPNHKYQTFGVTNFVTGVTDSCDTTLGIGDVVIEKVTSDELENSAGDGNTLNDIVIAADCRSVQLRAERDGGGNGRVYTITLKVSDGYNTTRVPVKVVVPHNPGETPVDSGVHYTVVGNCP
jgi:uncharacterized repeat protein (TIGR01451 family)